MNKLIKNLIIAVSILLFVTEVKAQDAPNITDSLGMKQGHWIKYENQKKIYDGNFVNSIPEGKFIYFSETGTPKAITIFSQNGKVAYTQHLNSVGKIIGEGKYVNQQKDSLWKFYNDEGKLLSIEIYLNGVKNGSCKVYYTNGQLSEDKTWVNGFTDGSYTTYFENGEIKSKGQSIQDKLEGKTTFYYPSGKLGVEGYYKNDFKDGSWKYYNEDGTIKKTVLYKNGKTSNIAEQGIISKEEEARERKQYENSDTINPYKNSAEPK